ncbi:hypothetical protein CTI12_AA313950 [Artemisia annua]|uniref:Homologous recombination OB-fold protein OB-fold domain-containing protein n=1 Tax=Artemisia annua TaxID=35608 RepID=A0A2U1N280_ARTAN|nr:hypothetical protein CTI12_AA313950 [Artemisia annua]
MDNSDKLKNPIRPCNNHHLSRDRTPTLDYLHSSHSPEKEECVISTQEYIRKVVEDVGEDEDFTRGPWLSVVEFVNANGGEGVVFGCLGDIKSFINNGKVDQVVAIIKSCTPNALGDLTVTFKDLSGSIPGAIHHKIINDEGGYGKDIHVGAAVIVHNVSVFSPNRSHH